MHSECSVAAMPMMPEAMIASSGALLLTLLMLFVGAGLFAFYEPMRVAGSEPAIFNEDTNSVFPVWIVTELPVGLRGLILAGIFAAAISSLDSILAALSQTTLGLLKPKKIKTLNATGSFFPEF